MNLERMMSMELKITSGKVPRAQKVIIYGPEGIGKTTLAAAFPDPLFIDTEGGSAHLDVRRLETPPGWSELLLTVIQVAQNPDVCRTLVLDTADWAENLCSTEVCLRNNKKNIEEFGYGKGYTYLLEEFQKLLQQLDKVIAAGIHVVVTAHAKMRKFEQPDEMGAYDRWELKLSKHVAPLLKEWADMVLFANYKTIVVTDANGKAKAQGGQRVMYTTHHPCWDAKNRHGLKDELPLEYKSIQAAIEQKVTLRKDGAQAVKNAVKELEKEPEKPKVETISRASSAGSDVPQKVLDLMVRDDIAEEEIRQVIVDRGKFPAATTWQEMEEAGFVDGWIIPYWDNIRDMIQSDPNRLPF